MTAISDAALRAALKSQFRSALATLRGAITKCTDELWLSTEYPVPCWQMGYHALFFAHFYMEQREADFRPWAKHRADCQYPDGIPGPADPASPLPLAPTPPYTRAEALEYCAHVESMVDAQIDAMDFSRTECGFPWYPMGKLEHMLVNIRHVQHHAAQLADRIRTAAGPGEGLGVDWVGRVLPPAK
ncbi:MAG: hypothetical protein HMLKMBBP_00486 [Planctomycetes bacterium]|nr:hypothetical protein [Planctomycetota bacterium]